MMTSIHHPHFPKHRVPPSVALYSEKLQEICEKENSKKKLTQKTDG